MSEQDLSKTATHDTEPVSSEREAFVVDAVACLSEATTEAWGRSLVAKQLDVQSKELLPASVLDSDARQSLILKSSFAAQSPDILLRRLAVGRARERRIAAQMLDQMLSDGLSDPSILQGIASDFLDRDPAIALPLSRLRRHLGGSFALEAKMEEQTFGFLRERLENQLNEYWRGVADDEPVSSLPPDEFAMLCARVRSLSPRMVEHLGWILESPQTEISNRLALAESLRFAAEPRLLSTFLTLLISPHEALVVAAARALSAFDDPRVVPPLLSAYRKQTELKQRIAIAGALVAQGELSPVPELRSLFAANLPGHRFLLLEALMPVFSIPDVEVLQTMLEDTDDAVMDAAARAMARIADAASYEAIHSAHENAVNGGRRSMLRDALRVCAVELSLRGDDSYLGAEPLSGTHTLTAFDQVQPLWRARIYFSLALLCEGIGLWTRASSFLERAASSQRDWVRPWVHLAFLRLRQSDFSAALAAFRRALSLDRRWVESRRLAIRPLVSTYLRKAAEFERMGRVDLASSLLDEAWTLDLRKIPAELRWELGRRHRLLRKDPSA